MLKFIGAALWICAATIGAVYYSFQTSSQKAADPAAAPPPMLGGLDYLKTNVISVPLLRDSRIDGYFLTRLVYTVEPAKLAKLTVPADALIVDQVYTWLYGNPQIDFNTMKNFDPDAFRKGIQDSINARIGDTLIHEVIIEQIDFLSKDEIRNNAIRRKTVVHKMPTLGASEETRKAAGGH